MESEIAIVRVAIEEDEKFLMIRRPDDEEYYGGFWELVGGKVEKGETPKKAILRETLEEINGCLELGRKRVKFRMPGESKKYIDRTFVIYGFEARVNNSNSLEAGDDVAEIELFERLSLNSLEMTPESRMILARLGYLT